MVRSSLNHVKSVSAYLWSSHTTTELIFEYKPVMMQFLNMCMCISVENITLLLLSYCACYYWKVYLEIKLLESEKLAAGISQRSKASLPLQS